jgi:hypothetical protein
VRIRKTYTDVSTTPEREFIFPTDVSTTPEHEFIFPTGRAWAQELGYPEWDVEENTFLSARVP